MIELTSGKQNAINAQIESIAVVLKNTKNSIAGKIGRKPAQAISKMADTLEKKQYGVNRSVIAKKVKEQSGM